VCVLVLFEEFTIYYYNSSRCAVTDRSCGNLRIEKRRKGERREREK
jgi:hypothetical protein